MALSMDEQRVLAEIERRLAADDPVLASCLTAFRRPGPALTFRSTRSRVLGSVFTVALVALVSLMVYAMLPFRAGGSAPAQRTATASAASSTAARVTSRATTGSGTAPALEAPASPAGTHH